jgi:hypothetical protein
MPNLIIDRKSCNELNNLITSDKRVFLECPDEVPGIEFGEPVQAELERTVVASDFFGEDLPEGQILIQHKCWFRPVKTAVKAHLTLAQVAGYRKAVYGLPEKHYPILFQHPEYPHIMISTTPLSRFIEGRFAPLADWQIVMGRLKAWLDGKDGIEKIDCSMSVHPAFNADEQLPGNAEEKAFNSNAEWFNNHIFFEQADKIGVFEGYISGIQPSGRQSPRPATRCDCTGEASMIPALDWALNKKFPAKKTTSQIMDCLFNGGKLADTDPTSPTYGGLYFYENLPVFYSDDNCRAAMGCILASELTANLDYSENILRCLLSILRTTGPQGFRMGRLDNPRSFADGKNWQDYQNEDYVEYRPHYQAYMWAGFLQAYVLTGHQDFLDKAKCAIRMTMKVFPKLVWTNGITQEYARLLLPLAFLVQIEDTNEHRFWLHMVTATLLENMTKCGTIREMMGDLEYGKYPAPRTNEEYGTTEAALIQQNGNPACDLVYTVNYAFIGLHEAAMATEDEYYKKAEDKLADFLCRIQVSSQNQSYLDGCWMRGFDYELWEFFGSSADNGWGAWCVESGWTNSWIATTFGLRLLKRSLLCKENITKYRTIFPAILEEMSIEHMVPDKVVNNIAITTPGAE